MTVENTFVDVLLSLLRL